jgi:hypothetical protein
VKKWCQTLALHIGKPLDDPTLDKHLDTVFAADAKTTFEERLAGVFIEIQANAPQGG